MSYQPIQDYGVVGDLQTVALVGRDGSIDWFCFPQFDSPSLFGALLDHNKGGTFRVHPIETEDLEYKQLYWPDTNILITRFLSCDGVGEVIDYMPVGAAHSDKSSRGLIRQIKGVRGRMKFQVKCSPAFDYGRHSHSVEITEGGAKFLSPDLTLVLIGRPAMNTDGTSVFSEFELAEGECATFELRALESPSSSIRAMSEAESVQLFSRTVDYWRKWIAKCSYKGRWREVVHRSALVLKLLVYEPTGAIVAAPTTSLPEAIGADRNWDYRYTWIRDAAFTIYSLLRIGFTEEATKFMQWLEARCKEMEPDGSLQIMYRIDGGHNVKEEILDHLEGYRNSSPVRIGNDAAKQLQLDIFGELMDSVYLYNKYGTPISYELWTYLRRLTNWVCENWCRTDEAIWEVRSGRQHFIYSRLMCWVAVDRALRLADKRSFPADRERWIKVRDQIYEEIQEKGWSSNRQAFIQHYGSESLDASLLLMPLVFFMSHTDPRMLSTIDAINRPSRERGLVSDGLVFRYNTEETPDGLKGQEGTFNMCSFWLVEALTRAGEIDKQRLQDARLMFERMLGYANHLGLYAEQTGPRGEALGNFPQAFTHLALISAAFNLDRSLGKA